MASRRFFIFLASYFGYSPICYN
ncbi:hypothetical protein [Listeria innocua]